MGNKERRRLGIYARASETRCPGTTHHRMGLEIEGISIFRVVRFVRLTRRYTRDKINPIEVDTHGEEHGLPASSEMRSLSPSR